MRYIPKTIPYIIAEVGACHNNDLDEAIKLIDSSASAGCQAVKFQLYDAKRLSERRHAPELFQAYYNYRLPYPWLPTLRDHAARCGLDFMLSVYDEDDLLHAIDYADCFKISSFESSDSVFLYTVAGACRFHGKWMAISTGLSTPGDLTRLRTIRDELSCPIAVLHCISSYPAACEELNLSVIHTEDLDGYSDHSADVLAGAFAVSVGANILEVHVKSKHTSVTNPDWMHALLPNMLADYVLFANKAYRMRGTGVRVVTPGEQANLRYKHTEGS